MWRERATGVDSQARILLSCLSRFGYPQLQEAFGRGEPEKEGTQAWWSAQVGRGDAGPFMSVTAHSPYLGHKRLLSDHDSSPEHQGSLSPKRLRTYSEGPLPACSRREVRAYRVGKTTLAALKGLFPGMDEKVVVEVLDTCGNNIDEAIKRLNNLQLSLNGTGRQGGSRAATPPFPSPPLSPPPEAGAAGPGPGSAAAQAGGEPSSPARTPAQWVEGLVQQMASARDVADARGRAANELRAFEQVVIQTANRGRQAEVAALQSRVSELTKENTVLKRAVAIQQSRWQEAVAANKQQAAQAEGAVSQLQAKIHSLEMSNYSLSMHLRQATGTPRPDRSHPDVF